MSGLIQSRIPGRESGFLLTPYIVILRERRDRRISHCEILRFTQDDNAPVCRNLNQIKRRLRNNRVVILMVLQAES